MFESFDSALHSGTQKVPEYKAVFRDGYDDIRGTTRIDKSLFPSFCPLLRLTRATDCPTYMPRIGHNGRIFLLPAPAVRFRQSAPECCLCVSFRRPCSQSVTMSFGLRSSPGRLPQAHNLIRHPMAFLLLPLTRVSFTAFSCLRFRNRIKTEHANTAAKLAIECSVLYSVSDPSAFVKTYR